MRRRYCIVEAKLFGISGPEMTTVSPEIVQHFDSEYISLPHTVTTLLIKELEPRVTGIHELSMASIYVFATEQLSCSISSRLHNFYFLFTVLSIEAVGVV